MRQSATEDVSRQVQTPVIAQRTVCNDPGVRHRLHGCWDVLATALAPHGVITEPGFRQVPHQGIIGEYKAKVIHRPNASSISTAATTRVSREMFSKDSQLAVTFERSSAVRCTLPSLRPYREGSWNSRNPVQFLREASHLHPIDDPENQMPGNSEEVHKRDNRTRSAYGHSDPDRLSRFGVVRSHPPQSSYSTQRISKRGDHQENPNYADEGDQKEPDHSGLHGTASRRAFEIGRA